ncbi:MAG: preprotein translocase subunit SecE [Solirubrobacterales bacterium]|nr:preprotein translocase subunit SecE [Solirubrobacterales bacterium]MBV9472643.1 preprotein translocase subunit SecE [Solirubrobacterales bacterium]
MARNRKRAKARTRRPPGAAGSRPGLATARAESVDETPDALDHATPDVELAEAQLALGRPELIDDSVEEPEENGMIQFASELEEEDEDEEQADGERPFDGERASAVRQELTAPGDLAPARRVRPGNRLIDFLQGSWRELQRVQWPDRRQVMQATGVVIGFVIVAGVFLGVADLLATKLVNLILK